MTWHEFVAAWARAHDGYDLTHAPLWRKRVMGRVYRLAFVLSRFGARPTATMIASAVCSCAVALLAWLGGPWPAVAGIALVLGLGADQLTASLWVMSGGTTRLGAFYQSLLERLAEACWLLALALLGAHLALIVACVALVWAHEYVRARASIGCKGGTGTLGDRSTRVWIMLVGFALAVASAELSRDLVPGVVTMVVFTWAAFALIGVCQLIAIIRKVLA